MFRLPIGDLFERSNQIISCLCAYFASLRRGLEFFTWYKRITDVVNQNFTAGYHEATWTRTESFGNKASQGMYLYSIRTNESNGVIRGTLVAK